jgi:hypothetical protein
MLVLRLPDSHSVNVDDTYRELKAGGGGKAVIKIISFCQRDVFYLI